MPKPVLDNAPLPLMPPLTVSRSAGSVTFIRFPGEPNTSGAEIVWLPERTLIRHSAAAPLVDAMVSLCPDEAAIVYPPPPLLSRSISSTVAEASTVTVPPLAAPLKRATLSPFCGSRPPVQFAGLLHNPLPPVLLQLLTGPDSTCTTKAPPATCMPSP